MVPQLNFGLRASLPIGYLPTKLLSDRPPRAETLPLLVVRLGFDSRYRSFLCLSFPIHLIYRPEKNDSVSILYLPRTVPLKETGTESPLTNFERFSRIQVSL